jgi:hypothetical protein
MSCDNTRILHNGINVHTSISFPSLSHVRATLNRVLEKLNLLTTYRSLTTSNYNSLTELHTPNIAVTTAHKVFSAHVLTVWHMSHNPNNCIQSSLHPAYNSSAQTTVENVSNSTSTFMC